MEGGPSSKQAPSKHVCWREMAQNPTSTLLDHALEYEIDCDTV